MRIPIKVIIIGASFAYGGIVTKVAMKQHEQIDILEKKLKKSKKKVKKYRKQLIRPFYKRTMLPRNGKAIPKDKPKPPIGFS